MDDAEGDRFVRMMATDWRKAGLAPADQALCAFAEKLTCTPGEMRERDLAALRSHGFSDLALHDATQVIAYFNYINRIADGLGVEDEPGVAAWDDESFGA